MLEIKEWEWDFVLNLSESDYIIKTRLLLSVVIRICIIIILVFRIREAAIFFFFLMAVPLRKKELFKEKFCRRPKFRMPLSWRGVGVQALMVATSLSNLEN